MSTAVLSVAVLSRTQTILCLLEHKAWKSYSIKEKKAVTCRPISDQHVTVIKLVVHRSIDFNCCFDLLDQSLLSYFFIQHFFFGLKFTYICVILLDPDIHLSTNDLRQ